MSFLKNEIKFAFKQKDNFLPQLIIINVSLWLVTITLWLFSTMFQGDGVILGFWKSLFNIPSNIGDFLPRFWTLISYQFMHSSTSLFHIAFNMLALYWFGRIVVDLIGNRKFIGLYITGGLFGGIIFLFMMNLIPYYHGRDAIMVGASGSVLAVVFAAAALAPEYRFNLILFGPVKIIWIAAFYGISAYVGLVGQNAGGEMAHLGGAFFGWFYVTQQRKGVDWGKWVYSSIEFFRNLFKRKPKLKVSKGGRSTSGSNSKTGGIKAKANSGVSQAEIDKILDKISQSGYESLTKEEKDKLFSASKND